MSRGQFERDAENQEAMARFAQYESRLRDFHAMKWNKRLDKLERTISSKLNHRQRMLWTNCMQNAETVAKENGLKDMRDFEYYLNYIHYRTHFH